MAEKKNLTEDQIAAQADALLGLEALAKDLNPIVGFYDP